MKINCSNGLDVISFYLSECKLYRQQHLFEGLEEPETVDDNAILADLINPIDDFSGLIPTNKQNGYVFIDPIDGRWTLRVDDEYNDIHHYSVKDLINTLM